MNDDESKNVRRILGYVAMVVGALVGWAIADWSWRFHIPRGFGWNAPQRDWSFVFIGILCSLALATLALAVVRFRDLPNGNSNDFNEK